jgi:S1-C subfamily serine protease
MKNYLLPCLLSGLIGAAVVMAWHRESVAPPAVAQVPVAPAVNSAPALDPATAVDPAPAVDPGPAAGSSGRTVRDPQSGSPEAARPSPTRRQILPPRNPDLGSPMPGSQETGAQAPEALGGETDLTPEEQINVRVYENVNRSVVHITTQTARPDMMFFMETPSGGAGSGSVLDKQGHILTNYHVIEGARDIRVMLFNGEAFSAGVVGQDPANDIAVLRIDAPADLLFPVTLGDSSGLKVGQKIYAIGNPFGLERTLTVGIISSLNRTLPSRSRRTMKSIIQIDAALNRGNSGGPLLNSHSRLVGMNTAIASSTGENTGVGFAIPINTIRRVVPQLIENGRVIRADIGITRVYQTDQGLVIATLTPGGPAERAGLQGFRVVRRENRNGPYVREEIYIDHSQADRIVELDGNKITSADELLEIVESKQPGDTITVTVVRQQQRLDILLTLGDGE